MAVTGVDSSTSTTYTSSTDSYENPDSILSKDDFLMLFLQELQNQDPTAPMEADKILEQTAQLTQLETNEQLKDTLDQLSAVVEASSDNNKQFNAVSGIGKLVDSELTTMDLEDGEAVKFELYYDQPIKTGFVEILNEDGETVRSFSIDELEGQSGMLSFEWDGTDDDGRLLADGSYSVESTYRTPDEADPEGEGEEMTTVLGRGIVESVRFDNGETLLKVGSSYIPMSSITQFS